MVLNSCIRGHYNHVSKKNLGLCPYLFATNSQILIVKVFEKSVY